MFELFINQTVLSLWTSIFTKVSLAIYLYYLLSYLSDSFEITQKNVDFACDFHTSIAFFLSFSTITIILSE